MTAMLNGVPLHVNPRSIQWDYSLKIATTPTIGGKVIQLYGVRLGDVTISGRFPEAEHLALFNQVADIVQGQQPTPANPRPDPVRFLWEERGWDFWVYVKEMSQSAGSTSVVNTNANFAPEWQMVFFVAEDNSDITKVAQEAAAAAYIRRISAGLGWQQSEWNGPLTLPDLSGGVLEYLKGIYDDAYTAATTVNPNSDLPTQVTTPGTVQ